MKKNYGLVIEERDPRNYVLGGFTSLPKIVLESSGQWDNFKPDREIQYNSNFDSQNCTGYGWNAWTEFMFKKLSMPYGDRSDRRLGIKAGTYPPGNDPRKVAQALHEYGTVAESSLPFSSDIQTVGEYFSYKGGEEWKCDLEGDDFVNQHEFRYEELWGSMPDREERVRLIKECLQYSPIAASFSAWTLKDGVYVDGGKRNNHWAVIFGWTDKGFKVFDSYDNTEKIISFDHKIEIAMRGMFVKSTRAEQLSILERIVKLLQEMLGIVKAEPQVTVAPPAVSQPEPRGSLLLEWATAIRDYEGQPGDLSYRNCNPGNLKGLNGKFLKFKTWDEGWNALLDYLTRAATGKHKAYKPEFTLLRFFQTYAPSSDKNNPNKYAEYVAKRLGVPVTEQIKNLI